jgi:hypothetical protein
MSTRQTLTEAEIGQMKRIAKELDEESCKAAIEQLRKDAFVNGDPHLHRVMQQMQIDKAKRWDGIGADLIKQAILWGVGIFMAVASFVSVVKGGK